MTERQTNTYSMKRGWQNHYLFENEDYNRRDAWCWLVENAVWKRQHPSNIRGKTIMLKRGQLCYSIRYLAEAWGWSKGKTERFINRLKTETMIETQAETGVLIITICNYDKFQPPLKKIGTQDGTQTGTAAGQQRDSSGTNKNQGNHGNHIDSKESIPPLPPLPKNGDDFL